MDVLFDLVIGLGVIGAAYFWVKTKLLKPAGLKDIEIFPSKGVPLVKRAVEQPVKVADESLEIVEPVLEAVAQVESGANTSEPSQLLAEQTIAPLVAEEIVIKEEICTQTPEDSVLRRHYFSQLAAERQAITNPYPSDSVLRRHVDSMLAATFAPAKQVKPVQLNQAETDSDELINLASTRDEEPQDSVLKRHYQQLLASKMAEVLV